MTRARDDRTATHHQGSRHHRSPLHLWSFAVALQCATVVALQSSLSADLAGARFFSVRSLLFALREHCVLCAESVHRIRYNVTHNALVRWHLRSSGLRSGFSYGSKLWCTPDLTPSTTYCDAKSQTLESEDQGRVADVPYVVQTSDSSIDL